MAQRIAPGVRRILLALALVPVVLILSYEGIQPPRPKPATAPASEFSGERAREILNRLVGDGVPHPVGGRANDAVGRMLMDELRKSGYTPGVQTAFSCSGYGVCAVVNNVVARLEGSEPGDSVLLAAHYDSVPAGPGASDDGAGVAAVLEIARALKSNPRPRHSIIFLLADGEEAGLLGARAFTDGHPWAKEVRAAVNLDARGSSGPSLMFETGSANEWAVRLYAMSVPRPATSSIFYEAYKQLPNDTDFTVFKAAGFQGMNFAFIGDVAHYHTPLDNFENASAASIEHHGVNAFGSILALANADLSDLPQTEAVYFDVFGRGTIIWPASRTFAVAIVILLLMAIQIAWLLRTKRLRASQYVYGLIAWLSMVIVSGGVGFTLSVALRRLGALPVNWVAHPLPLVVTFWSIGIAAVAICARVFAKQAGFWGTWAGVWTWWTLLAVLFGRHEAAVSYVLLVPSAVAALAGLAVTLRRTEPTHGPGLAAILPLLAAGAVGFASAFLLYEGIGARVVPAIAVWLALLISPAAPLIADLDGLAPFFRLGLTGVPIVAVALGAFLTVVVPAYSAKSPERVNIIYWQDGDTEKSKWVVEPNSGKLPEPIRVAASFARESQGVFPWSQRAAFVSEAPALEIAAPTFTVLESTPGEGKRFFAALLRSERGAPVAAIFFPPHSDVSDVRMEGVPIESEASTVRRFLIGWSAFECATMPSRGVEIRFSLPAGQPVEVYVQDQSFGLPLEGSFLLKARPLTATESQNGDVSIVTRHVVLNP